MYIKSNPDQLELEFYLPFAGELNPNNRWVILANQIDWLKYEELYAKNFNDFGPMAKSFRVALGALLIQKFCGLSDEETVNQIMENIYLQYFLGYDGYIKTKPFDSSLMTHFRKRISQETINTINEEMFIKKKEETEDTITNKGKYIYDATCVPQDIRFPLDVSLLFEAFEKTHSIISIAYDYMRQVNIYPKQRKKPRTYKQLAKKSYLEYTKSRGRAKNIKRIKRKLIQYDERCLRYIDDIINDLGIHSLEDFLSDKQIKDLGTIRLLVEQQRYMYDNNTHSVQERIVSIAQPHVRPIIRKKDRNKVEFGAKIQIVEINGYVVLDRLSWDNFNEGITLIDSLKHYRETYGYYPEVVMADAIYKTRDNKTFCKENNIRFTGNKNNKKPKFANKEDEKLYKQDLKERQRIEGKFGNGKRKFGLGLNMCKLKETSETSIALDIFVLNLDKLLKQIQRS